MVTGFFDMYLYWTIIKTQLNVIYHKSCGGIDTRRTQHVKTAYSNNPAGIAIADQPARHPQPKTEYDNIIPRCGIFIL
jgi:hypothetical protein